jgi:uncharacterized phiE125 gp8 family phage protein
MDWRLARTAAPSSKPVTLAEVKRHARVDTNEDNTLLSRLIDAATAHIDGPYGIGVCMATQTWEWKLDRFPIEFRIPLYPVQSVGSIEYVDENGSTQTLASSVYRVDTHSNPARITLSWNQSWPSTRLVSNAVTVTFDAGYSSVPEDLRQAVLMLVSHWYENRETANIGNIVNRMPFAVDAILDRYRVPGFA